MIGDTPRHAEKHGGDPRAGGQDLEAALGTAWRDGAPRDTIASLLGDSLRGQSRGLSGIMLTAQVAVVGLAAASVFWFFAAQTTKMQIFHAASFLWLMSAAGMIKAWFWMQIHRNRVLREVKRLELRVAVLAERMAGDGALGAAPSTTSPASSPAPASPATPGA